MSSSLGRGETSCVCPAKTAHLKGQGFRFVLRLIKENSMKKEFTREDGQVIILVTPKRSRQVRYDSRIHANVSEPVFKQHLLLVDNRFI